jgi:O-antigen ligase/tetratricopeptide (TPR) repeat protein
MENHERPGSEVRLLRVAQDMGWLLVAALPPLWVNLWGQQPFELSKASFVRMVVWLLAGLVLAECLSTGRSLRRALAGSPVAAPVGILALAILVTTITAVDWRLAVWGSYERAQGTATLLSYLLLCLLAASRPWSPRRARMLVATIAMTGGPLVLLGVAQSLGWRPGGLVSDARSPLYATLGRANFLGAYLAMLAPLTLALALTAGRGVYRRAWLLLLAGELVIAGLTLARSAWLAAAVALSVFALLHWGPRLVRGWRRFGAAAAVLLFVSGPLSVVLFGVRQLGSTAARLTIWEAVLKLIAQRPLLGYGADTLSLVFPRVYPPDLVYYQGREFYIDRAHNLLLDWTVTAGVPGLLAFLLVVVTFVLVAVRALRTLPSARQRVLLAGIVAAVLGNTANNLVSFDVTATATATWLLIGLGTALAVPQRQASAVVHDVAGYRRAAAAVVLAGLICAGWQVNARPLLADSAARAAYRYLAAGEAEDAVAAAERAVRLWSAEPAHAVLLAQCYWQQAAADRVNTSHWLGEAERALLAARELRPGDARLWVNTAAFYRSAAVSFGKNTRDLADDAYFQALARAPNDATIYTAWGRAYLEDGDASTAAQLLRQAVFLDATHGEAYLYLAAAEQALGRLDIALADYREAARLVPKSSDAYVGMAEVLTRLNRPAEAVAAAEAALARDPTNAHAVSIRAEVLGSLE